MGYTVTECPNEPDVRDAFRRMDMRGLTHRNRGRGLPPGKTWRDVEYGTPMGIAPKFTAYIGKAPYVRFRFLRMDGRRLHVTALGRDE